MEMCSGRIQLCKPDAVIEISDVCKVRKRATFIPVKRFSQIPGLSFGRSTATIGATHWVDDIGTKIPTPLSFCSKIDHVASDTGSLEPVLPSTVEWFSTGTVAFLAKLTQTLVNRSVGAIQPSWGK